MNISERIAAEERRQQQTLTLIASENYALREVRQALASSLTNKYAEGYPGKRYYAGCSIVDGIETIAIEQAKKLFGAEHANVQPHSGSQANMALYAALLSPGDTIMGMNLAAGGHLTHGHPVNFSGQLYNTVSYTVDPITERIDYEVLEHQALKCQPKLIIVGASSYSRIIDYERIRKIANQVGAYCIVDIAHTAGLIAARLYPSPIPYADGISGTTHKTLRGPRGGFVLSTKTHQKCIDRSVFPGIQGGPAMNVIAAKALAFEYAITQEFKDYQKHAVTNASVMVEAFKKRHYRIVSDGTDMHLFVLDLRQQNITGYSAEKALEEVGIIVSRSCIPCDPLPPTTTSGMRLGTLAVTARGMGESHVSQIVDLIDCVIKQADNVLTKKQVAEEVRALCSQFPL